jgi:hypothetical protein
VPNLKTILARLLEEDGQTTVVVMMTGSELPFVCKSMWWIFEKFEEPNTVSIMLALAPSLKPLS